MKMPTVADLEAMQDKAEKLMSRCRINFLKRSKCPKHVFFGQPLMQLDVVPDWSIDTACTDGKELRYNPSFWLELGDGDAGDQLRMGVAVHEVLHCTNRHFARRGQRDPLKFNVAADLAINPIILEAGFSLPDFCVFPKTFGLPDSQSAEWYYARLPDDWKQQLGMEDGEGGDGEDGDGDGDGDEAGSGKPEKKPGKKKASGNGGKKKYRSIGDVKDAAPDEAGKADADRRWGRITIQAAERAAKAGDMPGSLQANIDHCLKAQVDYWALLRNFMSKQCKDDYTWSKQSRRHIADGKYLPALYSERIGKIVVAVDCSGSCWNKEILERFCAEVDGMRDLMPSEIVLLYHDTQIQGEPVVIENGEPFKIAPRGAGGTDHRPVFDWVERNDEDVEIVICLTDLETVFPRLAPCVPVLWVSLLDKTAPFGDVIHITT